MILLGGYERAWRWWEGLWSLEPFGSPDKGRGLVHYLNAWE